MFMKFLTTQQTNIRVGYMKRRFFHAFLCLILSGCFGDSDKGSTSSSKKGAKECTNPLPNGKGGLLWNKATKKYGTTCTVISCDAGYDNAANPAQCGKTQAGYYSLAKDKSRKKCLTTFPPHSLRNTATGTKSETDCWKCESGSLKNTNKKECTLPAKGKYYDQGSLNDCDSVDSIPDGGFKEFSDYTGAVPTARDCNFSCNTSYEKILSTYSCNKAQACAITDGDGFTLWDTTTNAFSTTCTVETCNAGFDNTQAPTTQCQQTAANFYSPANDKTRTACPTPGNSSSTMTTGLRNPQGCFNCTAGYWKNPQGSGSCDVPDLGKWVDATDNLKKDCTTISNANFNTWLAGAADAAKKCPFSCSNNLIADTQGRTCVTTTRSCSSVPNGSGTQNWETPNNRYGTCTVETCNAGFVKNTGANSCNIPDTGKYAVNGVEKSCSPITGDSGGFDAFAVNTGAVTAANGCGFSCNAGFVKDSSGRECNYPSSGNYVNASGAEVGCTDITGITGFGSWLEGAATADDACPFSCASGYTVSGRICRKPEMLALGRDSSRILFSTGEVEAWGKVSDHTWRTHIKEDLGSNTPQALVSGYNHQCIILENAGQNHGSLMCWGQNGNGELGVGDTINRTTPTAVTATILGDTGDGSTPNTVKSVAAGEQYTCALLNNNTVVCWGNNSSRQIGGSIPCRDCTTSGTVGSPLGSGTANRIAAGSLHTCALLSDKSVKCWGFNDYGQTDGGTPNLGADKTATKIAVGTGSTCAILNNGSVKCWGLASPVLGVGETATKITAGHVHACALLNDKSVKCWGWNNNEGERGGGTSSSGRVLRGTLDDPLDGQTAIQIAAGHNHTCAIMESDNSVKCWGRNIDYNDTGFYGQIVGEVLMKGGSDGTGTSTGETATLTAVSTPTATSLDSNEDGLICKITLSGGTLGRPWVAKNYTTPLMYNPTGSTAISDVIDTLIAMIGSPVNIAGTNVTLSKSGSDKIAATTDTAAFDGMTLTIFHDTDGGNCTTSPVGTPITFSGTSGGAIATGLWVISHDFAGSGDKTVNLDSVHTDLGNSNLTKEAIADRIVVDVTGASWAGKQYKDLPYTATKVQNSDNSDCPVGDYCVLFNRLFKGTEGNYGIPFGDRDYEH